MSATNLPKTLNTSYPNQHHGKKESDKKEIPRDQHQIQKHRWKKSLLKKQRKNNLPQTLFPLLDIRLSPSNDTLLRKKRFNPIRNPPRNPKLVLHPIPNYTNVKLILNTSFPNLKKLHPNKNTQSNNQTNQIHRSQIIQARSKPIINQNSNTQRIKNNKPNIQLLLFAHQKKLQHPSNNNQTQTNNRNRYHHLNQTKHTIYLNLSKTNRYQSNLIQLPQTPIQKTSKRNPNKIRNH